MIKNIYYTRLIYAFISVVIMFIVVFIIINSPYYPGFENELNYLSPDLSENRTVIRDSVILNKKSIIKIVFEKKDSISRYDKKQFLNFISDLDLQIWNNQEYYSFDSKDVSIDQIKTNSIEIPIGVLAGMGVYSIYINSDFAVNPTYNIGIGIGRESKFIPLGKNVREFY